MSAAQAVALAVRHLEVNYGLVRAVRDVDLRVDQGSVLCLLGANGAGKSSLLNAVTGIIPKASGQVELFGADVSRSRPWDLVRAGLVQVPEGRQVFPHLNVVAHLDLCRARQRDGYRAFTAESVFEMFPRLHERRRELAGNLSGGEQQMLALGRALLTQPRVLLLDEPSLGLSPLLASGIIKSVRQLADEGLAVVLVEQNANLALQIADQVIALTTGSVAYEGDSSDPELSDIIRHAYLGQ